ncbi:aldehyde dehydrogenase [Prosthecomicrobium pneumaticum]|uniref:Lactaldehyde dehydrogenase/glycolaldehyde dehydrogenase n=1 Tax=Prosthecomicrobium pneumaticum TaxID=81895 RepID=A0A7W9FQR0_9HYPH|nr:aldehyde dehydrogenase [Prosthecomicrobium pneumaticum]MBB5755099.1 lactaldehyde dehydrogenase/glycolaldehyde dehydrogenase [Prosthecomicrobium pneumaticum]
MTQNAHFIDGRFIDPAPAGERIAVYNPATEAQIADIPDATPAEVDAAVAAARRAQTGWAELPAIERAAHVKAIAARIRDRADEIAETIVREQGKIRALAQGEVLGMAGLMDYMAEWARRIEGEIIPSDRRGETIFLHRVPIGVVAGILPWNFPFYLIGRKLAPALVAGNTIVIKPSEETPLNAFLFAEIVEEVGLPAGVFNLVSGRGRTTGAALSGHPGIDLVSFTGSVATGTAIMQAAAKNLTRVNLELGGKAPAIVLADADLDLAVEAITRSRINNTGQVCNCAERIFVEAPVADAFTEKFVERMSRVRYGDPLAETDLDMGPLVSAVQLQKVAAMVDRAKADGATVALGGHVAERGRGHHYAPTVLTQCRPDMEIMRSEIFGPVAPIAVVQSAEEAVAHANDTEYGLTSSLYTRDLNKAMKVTRALKFGETYVNRENGEAYQGFHAGRRKSGIGGADGKHGFYEYMETQTVYIEHG